MQPDEDDRPSHGIAVDQVRPGSKRGQRELVVAKRHALVEERLPQEMPLRAG